MILNLKKVGFLFDFPYRDGDGNILVLGINPGETERDWKDFPTGLCEESSEINFREGMELPVNSKRWFNFIESVTPETKGITLSELFFWSSNKLSDLDYRYGNWREGELINFCVSANKRLIQNRQVDLVLFFGISMSEFLP